MGFIGAALAAQPLSSSSSTGTSMGNSTASPLHS
jgi:hypothetical protein